MSAGLNTRVVNGVVLSAVVWSSVGRMQNPSREERRQAVNMQQAVKKRRVRWLRFRHQGVPCPIPRADALALLIMSSPSI